MDNKDHIVLSCNTLGTTVPEVLQNLQMSSLTLTKHNVESVDEQESLNYPNNYEDYTEHIQTSEYVNYYDSESYVVEQPKTEFPEDVLPQSDSSVNSKTHSENKELLKCIAKAELNDENTENGLYLNIKEEKDYSEYQFIVKTEGLEEQEVVQCKFYPKTLKNGCNLLKNSYKHIKVEINTPVDNGITELHQCQYCGEGFDNYNNMFVHISNDHKQEKSKCDICDKQFKRIGNLNRHILTVHTLDKPPEPITGNCMNSHVDFQHKCLQNDNLKLSCSSKEDGEDESENKATRNITNYDYGTMFECRCGKQFRSPIHLREHQKLIHIPKIPKTKNKRFQCDYCKKSFTVKWSLATHIKGVHFDYGRQFKCWCGKEFRSPLHLQNHERLVHKRNVQNTTNDKFQCDYCKTFFTSKSNVMIHIQSVHYDYGKRFDCWCGKQFRSPIHLRRHEMYKRRRNVQNTNHISNSNQVCEKQFKSVENFNRHTSVFRKLDKPPITENCVNCHVAFEHKCPLNGHSKLSYSAKVDGEDEGKNKVTRNITTYGTTLECRTGRQFRSPTQLREHNRFMHRHSVQNTNNGKFRCGHCKSVFKPKHNLIKHVESVHYDHDKRFDCWCGKQYRSRIQLLKHQRLRHRPKIPKINNGRFKCDSCKNFYTSKYTLIAHIKRLHYDYGKRFDCWCGKQYRSPIHLRIHEKLIHLRDVENTNNVKFQCDYCKGFFKTKTNLSAHIQRIHYDYGKRFDCWCGKQFRSPFHLTTHKTRMHWRSVRNIDNGELQCDYCKFFFKTRVGLVLHIKRLHYDYGKRFNCWCGKQFRSPIQLRAHKRNVHPEY